jgi:hypothetical protein
MSRTTPTWLARLVLAIYLAVVPFQGIAATIEALVCHEEAAAGAAQGSNEHAHSPATQDAHGPVAAGDTSDGDSGDAAYGGHLCCQLVVAALPSRAALREPQEFSVLPSSPDVFLYVTFLQRFQRPPLA